MDGSGNPTFNKLTLFDKSVFEVFVHPAEVAEVRIPHFRGRIDGEYVRGSLTGYFDDHDAVCQAVQAVQDQGHDGIYNTLQVIDPRQLGRAFNRFKAGIASTSDGNVLCYRWLPIDIDPVRPSGISSSDTELEGARLVRDEILSWVNNNLAQFSNPIKAFSGNGYHLLYRLPDIENNDGNRGFIKNLLIALDERFGTTKVSIDTTVFNPARIWKFYGTSARKGDPLPGTQLREARPHRMSYIEDLGGCR